MTKNKHTSLWLTFVGIVMGILVLSSVLTGLVYVLASHWGWVDPFEPNPLLRLLMPLAFVTLMSSLLTLFVAKRVIAPVEQLSLALTQVAQGNFTVRVSEDQRLRELKTMSHHFNRMVEELSGIETFRNDFIANVSHEFKTPLAVIEGYATLLADPTLVGDARHEAQERIIESTRQLSALTDNILQLSRLENQGVIVNQSPYALDEQLRQCLLEMEPWWSEKELNVELETPPVRITANAVLWRQVWINLISNAIKFTPKNGQLLIRVKPETDRVTVEVIDSGIGMSDAVRKHVFEKFYQADAARSMGGNGLGLALVKRIVDLCAAQITVTSQEGHGSAFTVTLPIQNKRD